MWVIEAAKSEAPLYWDGGDWSSNQLRAVKYSRREGAERTMINIASDMRRDDMRVVAEKEVTFADMTTVVPGLEFRCGSRDTNPLADRNFPGPDHWDQHKNGDRVCSFCGSLHPDDFVDIIKLKADGQGGAVHRSDKGYKWYAQRAGTTNAMDGGIKFYTWHGEGPEFAKRVNEQLDRIDATT